MASTVGGVSTTSNLYDTTYLAPNNTFNKFTVSGNYRDLPWRSVISARYTWGNMLAESLYEYDLVRSIPCFVASRRIASALFDP